MMLHRRQFLHLTAGAAALTASSSGSLITAGSRSSSRMVKKLKRLKEWPSLSW
jgi:hypothetical protein